MDPNQMLPEMQDKVKGEKEKKKKRKRDESSSSSSSSDSDSSSSGAYDGLPILLKTAHAISYLEAAFISLGHIVQILVCPAAIRTAAVPPAMRPPQAAAARVTLIAAVAIPPVMVTPAAAQTRIPAAPATAAIWSCQLKQAGQKSHAGMLRLIAKMGESAGQTRMSQLRWCSRRKRKLSTQVL